jgi:hypothetical protein
MNTTIDLPHTFEAVGRYIFGQRRLVGPRLPLDDWQFVAGLLFEQHSDRTVRRLLTPYRDVAHVIIGTVYDFSSHYDPPIPVTDAAVSRLLREQALEGSPDAYHTETSRWKLSDEGKRRIVTEWFRGEGSFADMIGAGMTYNLRTGEATWRKLS